MIKAVIFDLEGTVTDLFDGQVKAFNEVTQKNFRIHFTDDDLRAGYGMHVWKILKLFLKNHGVKDIPDEQTLREMSEEKQVVLRSKFRGELKVCPGAEKLILALKTAGIPIAIGSSSPRKNVEWMLQDPGLWDYFDEIVAVEDAPVAKPAPDIFLLAAEKLGVQPADCLVIEDSVHGITAGVTAGMKTLGVLTGGGTRKVLEEAGADLIVDTLDEVDFDLLASL